MKIRIVHCLLIISAIFGVACVRPSGYVVSLADTRYEFRKTPSVYLYLPKTATLEEKKFHDLLETEMKNLYFSLADDINNSDITLQFILAHNTIPEQGAFILPTTTSTEGTARDDTGNRTKFSFSTSGTMLIPYATYKSYDLVFLYMYDTRRLLEDSVLTPVWQVSFIAESKDFVCDTEAWVDNLLRTYQKEMSGKAKLQKNGTMEVYQWHCGELQVIDVP